MAGEDVERASEERHEEMSAALKDLRAKMEAGEYEDPTVTHHRHTGELLTGPPAPRSTPRSPPRSSGP